MLFCLLKQNEKNRHIHNQKIFGYFLFIDIANYHNIGSG